MFDKNIAHKLMLNYNKFRTNVLYLKDQQRRVQWQYGRRYLRKGHFISRLRSDGYGTNLRR